MIHPTVEKKLIKETLTKAKTIAMVGVSFDKEEETRTSIRRRPSIIVMKYLQEFGYRVVPVNPSSAGKKICGEIVAAKLEDISLPIDIVNVFNLFESEDNDDSIEVQGSLQSIIMELLKNIPLEKIESIKKYSKKELDYVNSIKK